MNQVMYWNSVLLEASRRDHSQGYANTQQAGPTRTSRAMAIVHLAIHDAIAYLQKPNAAYLHKIGQPPIANPGGINREDAIDGAAFRSLTAMYPAYADYFTDALGTVGQAGFNFGTAVADAILAVRANDGSQLPDPPPGLAAYGQHKVDPYNPGQGFLTTSWGQVKHFVGTAHTPLADYPGKGSASLLGNAHYRQDYDEVKVFGARERGSRTAEQTVIGVYWGYDGAQGIGVPPRLYNQIARKIALAQNLNIVRTAEMFAEINVAMADGGIDAWHYKYQQNLWRPVAGIRDEAPAHADPFWAPLGAPQTNRPGARPTTPPFPAYPSGHATFGAALFQVLRLRLGNPALTVADILDAEDGGAAVANEGFTFISDELDGRAQDADGSVRTRIVRPFSNYARAVWENAVSRVYLGVHWRFDGLPRNPADNIGGVPLGLTIGKNVHDFFNNNGDSLGGP
jgi:membrane-associated phospholipid phosphatase